MISEEEGLMGVTGRPSRRYQANTEGDLSSVG